MGGSSTNGGFAYGDPGTGLIHAQNNYQYYGGADRFFERKSAYFQIDLSSLGGISKDDIISATFNFYLTANDANATSLKHLTTQSTLGTGDAQQQLAGTANVESSTTFTPGWNAIDLTSFVKSDIEKGYAFTVLSIPEFVQSQDENRLLSLYGGSAAVEFKPSLQVALVPEPTAVALFGVGAILLLVTAVKKSRRDFFR